MRQIAERDLRRLAHNPAVVSLRAIVAVIADLRGGKGQLQQPCVKILGLEHSATLSTNNLELVRGINGAGNLREGIGIRASSTTLSSNNLASFYYSRGRYFERAAISMGARAMQGIGSNLWS